MYLNIILQEGGGTQGKQGGHSHLTKQKITYSTLDLISSGGGGTGPRAPSYSSALISLEEKY